MVEVLRILLGALVVASLATLVAYVVIFLSVAAWTVLSHRGSPRDPLADELDEVLAELSAVDSAARLGGACPPKALVGVPSPMQHGHGQARRFS